MKQRHQESSVYLTCFHVKIIKVLAKEKEKRKSFFKQNKKEVCGQMSLFSFFSFLNQVLLKTIPYHLQ